MNKPDEPGQLGFVIYAEFVDVSPEAIKLLKTIHNSCDDLGEVDVFETDDGRIIFSWIGGEMKILDPSNVSGSNTYSPHLLKPSLNVEIDPKFIAYDRIRSHTIAYVDELEEKCSKVVDHLRDIGVDGLNEKRK